MTLTKGDGMKAANPGQTERQRRPQKTAGKTAVKTAVVPQPHGGALLAGGQSGNRGGSGRPPDAFKQLCRALASSAEVEKAVREILKDTKHPAFIGALKWATEHGYGKARESLEVTGKDGKPIESQVWHFGAKKVAF